MKKSIIPLNLLALGKWGRVKKIELKANIRRRLFDLGLITDTKIEVLGKSPLGDPIAYGIRGTVIALRSEESSGILVEILGD